MYRYSQTKMLTCTQLSKKAWLTNAIHALGLSKKKAMLGVVLARAFGWQWQPLPNKKKLSGSGHGECTSFLAWNGI
jgi:hypothetical protein